MTGNITTPAAVVKLIINGEESVTAKTGVGPVDTAINAVQNMIGKHKKIKEHDKRLTKAFQNSNIW